MARLIYSRGFPYGAPLVMVRGGATKDPGVRADLKAAGFSWDSTTYSWRSYMGRDEFATILRSLVATHGCEAVLKSGSDDARLVEAVEAS